MQQAMKSEVTVKIFNTQPGVEADQLEQHHHHPWVICLLSPSSPMASSECLGDSNPPWQLPPLQGQHIPPHTRPEPKRTKCHFTGGETEAGVEPITRGHVNTGRAGDPHALYYTRVGTWTLGTSCVQCPTLLTWTSTITTLSPYLQPPHPPSPPIAAIGHM